jgi:hypothetical protein
VSAVIILCVVSTVYLLPSHHHFRMPLLMVIQEMVDMSVEGHTCVIFVLLHFHDEQDFFFVIHPVQVFTYSLIFLWK